jgi:hypothetical protein
MLRTLLVLLALLSLTSSASSETAPITARAQSGPSFETPHTGDRLLQSLGVQDSRHSIRALLACCKVCSVGKACGDTCISRDKTCHVGPGCACDG